MFPHHQPSAPASVTRFFLLAAVAMAAYPVSAQESPGEVNDGREGTGSTELPVSSALRVPQPAIDVDGYLDEEAWSRAEVLTDFVQREPVEGIPAEEDTEVRLIFTDDALFIAARMWDSNPGEIATQLVRRDAWGAFDWFSVSLDPNLDRRTGYRFQISAAGVQRDEYLFNDREEDQNWNAIWESSVQRDDRGWTAELRIPLSQIRYEAAEGPQTWGINFSRRRLSTDERTDYALVSRRQEGVVSQFARLEGVLLPDAVRLLEAQPYILSSLHRGPSTPGDPFFDGSETSMRLGADVTVGLGSAFTLDATVNPDFGQVEADPAVINLSAFEVFFEERRPFFVENANLLNFELAGRSNNLFYSRRIGRSPQGDEPADADFVDAPDAATILGAAKVTGRTAGGLSVGGLAALTQAETGRAFISGDGSIREFTVEPQTEFGVLRVQQDLNEGASNVGVVGTFMNRQLPADGRFDFLPSTAFTGGVNFEHQWNDRTWALTGFLAGSHVQGDSAAILEIQEASNHFFQRPDATRESVDSTATDISGLEWRLQFDKRRGDHWTGSVWLGQVTRGLEINDLGFSRRREVLDGGFRLNYREIEPTRLFRSYRLGFVNFHNYSHEALDAAGSWQSWKRARTGGRFRLEAEGELQNFWSGQFQFGYEPQRYSRTATRGGPVMVEPGAFATSLRFNSDRRKAINVDGNLTYESRLLGAGRQASVQLGIEVRPAPSLEIQVEPRWQMDRTAAQYVTTTDALPYAPTFGDRYIFADLDRKTLSLDTRVNLTLSPTLSFQLFAQPQLSSGDYLTYRQLGESGTFEFRDFQPGQPGVALPGGQLACSGGDICAEGDDLYVDLDGDGVSDFDFGQQDFNFRSLLGNAVFRWEYRPGSTVFLVWQRQQSAFASVGNFDLGRDLDALWGLPADNVFIVKFNYWLSL